METIKSIFKSTNGTLHAILLLITGIALFFNFPGNELVGVISGIASLVGLIREWTKNGIKFKFDGNALAYILAGLAAIFPALTDLFDAGGGLIEAIVSKNLTLILSAAVLFFNMLVQQLKKPKPAA